MSWSDVELDTIGAAEELRIAPRNTDGTLRRAVPIWVVVAGEQVYVRTWYPRDNGWFGHAVSAQRAQIDVPGLQADVRVEDVGARDAQVRADVDAAYRAKYGAGVDRMVSDDAAATTLRLVRE